MNKNELVNEAMMELLGEKFSKAQHADNIRKAGDRIEKLSDEIRALLGYEHSLNYLPLIMLFSDEMLGLDGDALNPQIREIVAENFTAYYKEVPEC